MFGIWYQNISHIITNHLMIRNERKCMQRVVIVHTVHVPLFFSLIGIPFKLSMRNFFRIFCVSLLRATVKLNYDERWRKVTKNARSKKKTDWKAAISNVLAFQMRAHRKDCRLDRIVRKRDLDEKKKHMYTSNVYIVRLLKMH